MAIKTGVRRAGLIGACLLLASCAGDPAAQQTFEAECRTAGHAEGSEQFADCVEGKWARYRYVRRGGGGR